MRRPDTGLRQNGPVSHPDAFAPTLFDNDDPLASLAPGHGEASDRHDPPPERTRPPTPPTAPATPAKPAGWPEVEVRVSSRRRKTSEARWVGGRIVVSLPAHLSGEAREKTIAWLVDRLVAKHPLPDRHRGQ